ncbi:MAG: NAD(P)-dependent oxidoreductase [Spirochaetota bacterium]|nr:NAD(P)-dependent oxidoreductase [Spirochaetota bacterium]
MKILVTGATGFIGNYVIHQLLKQSNIQIIASSQNKTMAQTKNWFSKVTYIPANLSEQKDNYFDYFNKPDLLIHISWEGLPNYKDFFHFEKNLFSNYFFLKNIIQNGLKSVNIIGTCFEYGMQNGCLSEELETKPSTSYGLAKDTLRKFIEQLKQKYDFNYKWIRLFYLYGEGQNPNSLLAQLDKTLENNEKKFNMSGGEQLRDYLPIEKLAEYIVKIVLQNKITGIINCCSGQPISVRKLVDDYLKQKNKSIELNLGYYPYPDYEPMAFWGNNAKLKKILKEYP